MNKIILLNELIKDENRINKNLYSSGPYWNYKNTKAITEIKKKGLNDFRGLTAGIGTSFADNLVLDIRNEFNIKGRIIGKFFSLPLLRRIFEGQLKITKDYIHSFLKYQSLAYETSENVLNLLNKPIFRRRVSCKMSRAIGAATLDPLPPCSTTTDIA